jgi:hypothetical protein
MGMKTIYFHVHLIIVEIQLLQAQKIIHVVFGKMRIRKVLIEKRLGQPNLQDDFFQENLKTWLNK